MPNSLLRPFQELTARITLHGGNLLRRYHPHDLHQLRVSIRRTRSLLKQAGSGPARFFHESWGALFAITGPARDLDVLQATVRELLPGAEAEQLETLLRPRLANSHEAVSGLLESGRWGRHMAGWRGYMKTLENRPCGVLPGALRIAERSAGQAGRAALAADTDQAWHRFRIALKNLRYVAEALRDEPGFGQPGPDALINGCKVLQTLLGDWHDASVQLAMLDGPELADALQSRPGPAAAANTLRARLLERRSGLLDAVRKALLEQGWPMGSDTSGA
jgi:CHAD domain-containing protein